MDHMMIDIETLDTLNSAVVTQVGWVLFDADEIGKPQEMFPDIQHQINLGRTISASTLKWWMVDQPRIARERVFDCPHPCTLDELATRLRTVVQEHHVGHVWSHGPHFDMAILKDLLGDNVFHYRSPRDTRTLSDLAPQAEKPPAITKHSAGDDAYAQALWVQNMWSAITRGHRL